MMPGIGFIGKHLDSYIIVLKYGPIHSNVKVCFGLKLNQMKLTVTQFGSDGVAEPVYRLAYLRLGCPTHLASYGRST